MRRCPSLSLAIAGRQDGAAPYPSTSVDLVGRSQLAADLAGKSSPVVDPAAKSAPVVDPVRMSLLVVDLV